MEAGRPGNPRMEGILVSMEARRPVSMDGEAGLQDLEVVQSTTSFSMVARWDSQSSPSSLPELPHRKSHPTSLL